MDWADDAEPDTFRMRIWVEGGTGEQADCDHASGKPLGGGSVMVHTKK